MTDEQVQAVVTLLQEIRDELKENTRATRRAANAADRLAECVATAETWYESFGSPGWKTKKEYQALRTTSNPPPDPRFMPPSFRR